MKNTTEYNPLLFQLTIPNRIKFNYGWFTPNTNNVISIAGTAYNLLARLFVNPFMLDSEREDYFGD